MIKIFTAFQNFEIKKKLGYLLRSKILVRLNDFYVRRFVSKSKKTFHLDSKIHSKSALREKLFSGVHLKNPSFIMGNFSRLTEPRKSVVWDIHILERYANCIGEDIL